MKYQTGSIGRIIVAKFDDGDEILEGIKEIAIKENLRSAVFYLVGGLKTGSYVVGPETEEMPPVPIWNELKESHESFGIGTIFWEDDKPLIHFHGAYGKRESVKMGCLRNGGETFIILEAIIIEITGINAVREFDPVSHFKLLKV